MRSLLPTATQTAGRGVVRGGLANVVVSVSVRGDNLTNTLIIRIRADHREITLV